MTTSDGAAQSEKLEEAMSYYRPMPVSIKTRLTVGVGGVFAGNVLLFTDSLDTSTLAGRIALVATVVDAIQLGEAGGRMWRHVLASKTIPDSE